MYLLLVCRLYDITVIEKEKMYGKNLNLIISKNYLISKVLQ